MKPKKITTLLLFISSYSPLFLIFAVKDWDYKKHVFAHPWLTSSVLIVTALSIVLLFLTFLFLNKGNMVVTVKNVGNRSMDLLNYTIPYILSFYGFDLLKPADIISLGIFLFVLFVITVKSHAVFINPILAFLGYGLYDLEYEYDSKVRNTVVLTRKELQPNQRFYLRPLSKFLHVIVAEERENDE